MESSMKTECLSPPIFSNMEDNANETEYTEQFPASTVQTDICVEGDKGSEYSANAYSTTDSSKKQNYEDAFGFYSYAPSQAFNENCGSHNVHGCDSNENNCLIDSNEEAKQNYAIDPSAWSQPDQDDYQYSNLHNTENYLNMERNIAGLDAYDPQESQDGSTFMENRAYQNWYHGMNANAIHWQITPQELNADYYQNTNSMLNQADYISNYQYSYGKGNNFNHFPNGRLMNTFLLEDWNEAYPYYNENSLSPADYYEDDEHLPGQPQPDQVK